MTTETLSAAGGLLLSLALAYVPGLAPWFAGLDPIRKRLVLLACLLAVAAGALGLACAPHLAAVSPGWPLPCTGLGVAQLVSAFLATLVANQATYAVLPKRSAG